MRLILECRTWFSLLVASICLWGAGVSAQSALTADINTTLSLQDSTVVELQVPSELGGAMQVRVPIAGEVCTLDVVQHSVRSSSFEVVEVDNGQKTSVDPGEVVTFRGTVLEHKGSQVAGGLLSDGLWAEVVFRDGATYWVEPLAGRVPGYKSNQYVVYRSESVVPVGTCGVPPTQLNPTPSQPFGGTSSCGGSFCVAEIGADADFEFYTSQASSTSRTRNRIELVINTMNLQYERDVDVTHRITTILVRTTAADPYTATDSLDVLEELRDEWNNNQGGIVRDLAHLFTGKDMDGSTIGRAYVGVVCSATNHYGVSQSNWSTNFAGVVDLTAHEVGHNWDADHCSCSNPDYTMNASITGGNRFNTTDTVPDIVAHRLSRTCLDGGIQNDDCTNALAVGTGTFSGDTTHATQDGSTTCGSGANLDVWYQYTPEFSGTATIDTEGSTGLTDTVLSVHSGCLGTTANEIECDDLSGTGLLSTITMPVVAGETYLIRVAGFNNSTGSFTLNIAGPDCGAPVNDDCMNPTEICPGEYYGTTACATNDGDASCAFSNTSPDVWYTYTPRFSGTMIIDTCDSLYDTALGVYSGCPGDLTTELECDDTGGPCGVRSRIEMDVVSGTTYLIRVSGFNGNSGSYILGLSGPQCENDVCANARLIDTGTHYGTLQGASNTGEANCGSSADSLDMFYEFVAPYDGTFFATTCGTHDLNGVDGGLDTVLSIHSACPATFANQLDCDDDASAAKIVSCGDADQGTTRDSSVSTPVIAGDLLLIRVSHFSSVDPDDFVLNVGVIPENDDCFGALDVSLGGTYMGDTSFATNDGEATCGGSNSNPDVWYTYTANCDGTLQVSTCGSSDLGGQDTGIDSVLSLHSFCLGDTTNEITCNDQWVISANPTACTGTDLGAGNDSYVEYDMTQGETVLIRVSTWASTTPGPFVLNVNIVPNDSTPQSLQNGDFNLSSGWCFIDESNSGFVDFSSFEAVVTGGNDGGDDRFSYIEQVFTTYDTASHILNFDWSYASTNAAGFDEARWDLVDFTTGLSVVGGPLTLGDANGDSGTVSQSFSGTGTYSLRLGSFTDDGISGPGVTTYDNVSVVCDLAPGVFSNGDFSNPTGAPWCFTDESDNGSVDFTGGNAIVTGGNDGQAGASFTFVSQAFTIPAIPHDLSFDWSYSSTNSPGFDGAYWDLIDEGTGMTVVGGPVILADSSGSSGTEVATFNGTGTYTLILGTFSDDNFAGPGVSTFDNVTISTSSCAPVNSLSCSNTATSASLSWTNGDTYSNVRVYRNGALVATLPGTAFNYSEVVAAGSYTYAVEGDCSGVLAAAVTCSVSIPCDPVQSLSCSGGASASLTWVNGDSYTGIRILRDGALIATLAGSATSFTDAPAPGSYTYAVEGDCGGVLASPVSCGVTIMSTLPEFRRGDCNSDGATNIADAVYLLGNLFPPVGGTPNVLACVDACDGNDDGGVNIADAVTILGALFGMPSVPLPAPYPGCGTDPTSDSLDCATYSFCP